MNQILVSEKLYVTPDMRKKRNFFKVGFFISVFLVCILSSYGIYAQYDRNKSEEVSGEILANINFMETETTTMVQENAIIVILNKEERQAIQTTIEKEVTIGIEIPTEQKLVASDGTEYYTCGTISIPSININYPILSTTTVELLKIAPCKFWGPNPNEVRKFQYSSTQLFKF